MLGCARKRNCQKQQHACKNNAPDGKACRQQTGRRCALIYKHIQRQQRKQKQIIKKTLGKIPLQRTAIAVRNDLTAKHRCKRIQRPPCLSNQKNTVFLSGCHKNDIHHIIITGKTRRRSPLVPTGKQLFRAVSALHKKHGSFLSQTLKQML